MPNSSLDWSVIIAALAGSGVLGSVITVWAGRPKINAEAEKLDAESDQIRAQLDLTMSKASLDLINEYRKEVNMFRGELQSAKETIKRLTQENKEKDRKIFNLESSIAELKKHVETCEIKLDIEQK